MPVLHEMGGGGTFEVECTAVQPGQVGGFGRVEPNLRNPFPEGLKSVVPIRLQIGNDFIEPGLSPAPGRDRGVDAEKADSASDMRWVELVESLVEVARSKVSDGTTQAGDIECLAGGGERHGAFCDLGSERCKGDVDATVIEQIGVNLVADDRQVMLDGQSRDPLQFLTTHHTARRIVGITKQE